MKWSDRDSQQAQPDYSSGNTALDDDLLEAKEAEPLDDIAIEQTLRFDKEKSDTVSTTILQD